MAVESATYIDGLNPAYPAGGEPIAQGDDHLRLIKLTLKNTFPAATGPDPYVKKTGDTMTGRLQVNYAGGADSGARAVTVKENTGTTVGIGFQTPGTAGNWVWNGSTFQFEARDWDGIAWSNVAAGIVTGKTLRAQGNTGLYNSLYLTNRQMRVNNSGVDIEVVNAANTAVRQIFYDTGVMWSVGELKVGAAEGAGVSIPGGSYGPGSVELYADQPFIDFKTSAIDYRYRLTLSSDNLQIQAPNGAFRVGASGEAYSSTTANTADALTRKDYVDGQIASRPFADTCTAVGFNGGNPADPYIRYSGDGSIVQLMRSCNNAGRLGMSTGHCCEFHWNNGLFAQVDGATGWFAIQNSLGSDKRLKEQDLAEPKTTGLATVMALKPVRFEYKETSLAPKVGVRWGFFAQDLQAVDPALVQTGKIPEDDTEYLFYAEDGLAQLIAIQTRAIQELSAKVTALEEQLAAK
jgi:hypothetical protein